MTKERSMYMKGFLFLLFLSCPISLSINIGSDTAVTRFNVQQNVNDGDRIAGFAWLAGGFELADINTKATFDSVFAVLGGVALKGGKLILNQDLIFHNNLNFETIGDIDAQGHMLELSCSGTQLPESVGDEAECMVFLKTSETTIVDKNIFSLDWSVADTFLAVGVTAAGGPGDKVEVWEWNGVSSLTFKSGIAPNNRDVESVRWHPTANWLAIGTANNAGGDEVYIYEVDWSTGAFTLLDSVDIGGDARSVSWHPSGDYLAVGTSTNTQEVQVFPVSVVGVFGTPVIVSSSNVDVSRNDGCDWDLTGSYLAVAFEQSVPSPELIVYEFNTQPSLSLTEVANMNMSVSVRAVDWNQTTTKYLVIGFEGNVDVTAEVIEFDPVAKSLTIVADLTNINKTTQTVNWNSAGSCIAIGTETPNNNEFRVYFFDQEAETTKVISEFDQGNDTVRAVRWSRTADSIAVGGDDNIIYIYNSMFSEGDTSDPDGPGAIDRCFVWNDICVVLNHNITLNDRCILFSGCSSIDGRGHCLTLTPDSRIFVDTDSTLLMENLTIKGVNNRIIGAFDDSSTYSFKDVEWYLDGDYTFTKGHFDVVSDFHVIGEGQIFGYQSEVASTIDDCGRMILDKGLTFSYDPVTASRNLLQLTADTSELILHGATLYSTSTGLQLLKGKLIVDRQSFISNEGTVESEAIVFGDGINGSNNLCVEIFPAATLDVVDGCVVYNDA